MKICPVAAQQWRSVRTSTGSCRTCRQPLSHYEHFTDVSDPGGF